MSTYTLDQLANLKKAYARGVLKIREGDTWIEYNSMSDLERAIKNIEAELNIERQSAPRGSRRIRFGRAR